MSDYIIQCPSSLSFDHVDDGVLMTTEFRCRRESGHEGNHSSNVCNDAIARMAGNSSVTFRIDWRPNDGTVVRRWPKREDKA